MVRQHTAQPAFIGGEMSPLMLGRSDTERFLLGGQRVENFIARHQGPLVRRRGTQYIRTDDCEQSRLVNFEYSCSDGSMLRFGCGTALGGADAVPTPPIPVTASFEQQDGPFAYPSWLLTLPDDFESPTGERMFFASAYATGESSTKISYVPGNPALADCDPADNAGFCVYDFAGGYNLYLEDATKYDINTGLPTTVGEAIVCNQSIYGAIAPYNYYPSTGQLVTVKSDDFDALLNLLSGYFIAGEPNYYMEQVVVNNRPQWQFVRQYPFPFMTGFFATGSFRNIMWCPDGFVDWRYTDPVSFEDLGGVVARTGTPARTQHITGYDTGTRTYTGTRSTGVFTMTPPAGVTTVSGFYTFLVTPDVGDPYTVQHYEEYTVTPSTPNELRKTFPAIEDAEVTMTAWSFSSSTSRRDDLEDVATGETFAVAGTATWAEGIDFICPAPNTSAFDDFESYTDGNIVALVGGRGWDADGSLNAVDRESAYDDFELYTVGTIYVVDRGIGWASFGGATVFDYDYADDDFESYTVGTITTLDNTTSFWDASGTVTVYDYDLADDDFESYAPGTITLLDYADAEWAADGIFV